jgi:hypothetical protein
MKTGSKKRDPLGPQTKPSGLQDERYKKTAEFSRQTTDSCKASGPRFEKTTEG